VADDVQREAQQPTTRRKVSPEIIVAAIIAILLIIFIFQNDEPARTQWLFVKREPPVWAVIVVSAVCGYLIGQLIEFGIRRRRRARRHD
jgi:uncharacterized integral membrane protein